MAQTVTFLGIGLMGRRMAKNVLRAGHALRVYNRTPSKTEELRALGATVAGSAREAAQRADAVITMVADPPALRAVLEGPAGRPGEGTGRARPDGGDSGPGGHRRPPGAPVKGLMGSAGQPPDQIPPFSPFAKRGGGGFQGSPRIVLTPAPGWSYEIVPMPRRGGACDTSARGRG